MPSYTTARDDARINVTYRFPEAMSASLAGRISVPPPEMAELARTTLAAGSLYL